MFRRSLLVAIAALPALTAAASAQIPDVLLNDFPAFDAPSFFSPRAMDDLGLYVFKSDVGYAGENPTGLKLIWRQSGNLNLGVHAGVFDLEEIGQSILLGGEFYGSLKGLSQNTGLSVAWVLGAGGVFGDDYIFVSIPLGISVGMPLGDRGQIVPYIHPRMSFDILAIESGNDELTETDLQFAADLGAEIGLGERLILRLGYSFGDKAAFGAGVALRMPRKVVVR